MASSNEVLADQTVRHQIYLQRYSTGVVNRMIALLNRSERDIVLQMQKRLERIADKGFDTGPDTTKRLNVLLGEIRAINAAAHNAVGKELTEELTSLAEYESTWSAEQMNAELPKGFVVTQPPIAMIRASVLKRPFQGRLLKEWVQGIEAGKAGRIRDAIRIGLVEGQTVDQMVQRIRGTRASGYADGLMEIDRRGTAALVRTAVNHTVTAARDDLFQENADIVKGVQWVSTLDNRTTPVCQGRDGKVYPLGKGPRPPAHIGCLTGDALVSTSHRITGATKRWFDGELVVIRTAGGNELACTPNHPILTDGGWVAAGLLCEGGNVVCDPGFGKVTPHVGVNNQHMPSCIEDVAEATFRASVVAPRVVPTAAEDFHGDGIEGQVAVVASDCFLNDGAETTLSELSRQSSLIGRYVRLSSFSGYCGFDALAFRVTYAASCFMRRFGDRLSLIRAKTFHASKLLLATISRLKTVGFQHSLNSGRDAAQLLGNAANTDSALEKTYDDLVRHNDSFGTSRAHLDPSGCESARHSIAADTKLAANLLTGKAGVVELQKIVIVKRQQFHGFVFNLETEKGYYCANGVVTHNCRSTITPIVKSWKEMGIDADELPASTRASLDGQVPANQTYQDWLKKQPASVQDEILGPARADIFRAGKLPLEKFVDQSGKQLTLEQLSASDQSTE